MRQGLIKHVEVLGKTYRLAQQNTNERDGMRKTKIQKKKKHGMHCVLYTHKRYSYHIAVIGKRDD